MKPHAAFLAESVLCLAVTLGPATAAAQTVDSAREVSAPSPPISEPRPAGGGSAAAPPSTAVDTSPRTTVNATPPPAETAAAPSAPPVSPAPSAPLPPPPVVAPSPASARAAPAPRDAPPVSAPSRLGLGQPRYRDAHADRLLLSPTAETSPKGSFSATSYEIVLLQLGYALTDDTQISVTATPPLGELGALPADISLKTVVLRQPHVSVAALGSATGVLGVEELSGFLGRAGGVATFCVDLASCRLSFSMSTNVALIGPASLLFSGAGVNFRAGRIVSLIAELDSVIPLGSAIGQANGLLGGLGVRLSGRAWGVDMALMKAGKARAATSSVVPFLAVSYRYVP